MDKFATYYASDATRMGIKFVMNEIKKDRSGENISYIYIYVSFKILRRVGGIHMIWNGDMINLQELMKLSNS